VSVEARRAGILTFVAILIPIAAVVLTGQMEPIELLRAGDEGPSARLVEEVLGADALVPDTVGFDGQQFWAIAHTFPDLDAAVPHLDDPPYRLQRILQPALAALAGGGQASAFALTVLTVLGCALCVGAVTELCTRHGRPAGLGYLALVPLAYAIGYSTSEPLAFGLGFAGILLAERERHALAVVMLVAAALTRESAIAFALAPVVGIGVQHLWTRRRPPAVLFAYLIPPVVFGTWSWWLSSRFEHGVTEPRITPLGIFDASPTGFALGIAVIALAAIGAWGWRDVPVAWPVAAAFGAATLTYYGLLFRLPSIPRVSAPAVTLGLVALGAVLLHRVRAATDLDPEPERSVP
jgi:hypothetical protein